MAQALAKGFVKASLCSADEIVLSDTYKPSLDKMSELGYRVTSNNAEVRWRIIRKIFEVFLEIKHRRLRWYDSDVASSKICVCFRSFKIAKSLF